MNDWTGKKALAFNLNDQDEQAHTLNDYRGQWLLLYFYPKDLTPGCTIEANTFNAKRAQFSKLNCAVIGVSKDDERSKKKFCDKHGLKFPLLADKDLKLVNAYGLLKEKTMFGKKVKGIQRDSFLIDPSGTIVKHYKRVKPATHPSEVLADLKELQST